MTREEAIEWMDWLKLDIKQRGYNDIVAALNMAIKALEQEPTTKNDLGVDCISRDSAIKALDYDIKCFEFKRGVNRHMDDIAKLLNTIYETQANNIKALPSVTPQEPRWIPVSERLPKIHNYSEKYFATLKRGGVHVAMFTECDGKHWWTYDDVVAWMPLPKPYEPQESEDKS